MERQLHGWTNQTVHIKSSNKLLALEQVRGVFRTRIANITTGVSETSESYIISAIKTMRPHSKRPDSQMIFDYINKNSATNGTLDDNNKVI